MPLNTSLLVNWYGHSTGYFPTPAAYAEYLTAFAKDLKSHGWSIPYWNIGNEVPIWISKTYAEAFAVVFNAGAGAIHSVFPNALVGSDVLTAQGRMSYFASTLKGVGFLGFHFYPAGNLCAGSKFCIPNNVNGYLTDPSTLAASYPYPHSWQFISPRSSQLGWHNLTGHWLPVLDTETNLNTAQSDGSDPRLQTLFDAAWLAESYITASAQSMKGVVSYSLLSAYPTPKSPSTLLGAWGFGLGVEPTSTTETLYAPYWAAELWGSSVPAGAKELEVQTANSYYVPAIAVHDGSVIQLLVANLADVDTTIPITVTGAADVATTVRTLDQRSYDMFYNTTTRTEQLVRSGITTDKVTATGPLRVTIDGYGVAVVTFAPELGSVAHLRIGTTPLAHRPGAAGRSGSLSLRPASGGGSILPAFFPPGPVPFLVGSTALARWSPRLRPGAATSPPVRTTPWRVAFHISRANRNEFDRN